MNKTEHWYDGCVNDRFWRMNHLYHILTKEHGVQRFRMNWAQTELFRNLWHRNTILKARQLGMSTFSSIFMLDHCLHRRNFQAGIIDKSLPDAEEKLDKIRLACQMLLDPPQYTTDDFIEDPEIRKKIALHGQLLARQLLLNGSVRESVLAQKAVFANGSKIRIGTSLRGGTLQFLHVSEFGYVANNDPGKALEILSGGINAVPQNGLVIMESTHEGGKYGENYRITKDAMEAQNRKLTPMEYRFFFFPWWKQPEYRIAGEGHDEHMDEYFSALERQGIKLDEEQKRWYCVQAKTFTYRIKTEYPSTPEEAFSQQVEGAIYGSTIARLRAQGRIGRDFEADPYAPLYVSWDIGMSDYTTLWLVQPGPDGKFYVLDYYCANDKPVSHYIQRVQKWEKDFGQLITLNLLPHDAAQRDFDGISFDMKLYAAKFTVVILPRTDNVWKGIFSTRELLPHCVFHRRCSEPVRVDGFEYMSGIDALENYKTGRIGASGQERLMPLHDLTSHGADSFRYFVEGYHAGYVTKNVATRRYSPDTGTARANSQSTKAKGVPSWW